MRRSSLYFLLFVLVACISAAILPRLILKPGPRQVPEDIILDQAAIKAIDLQGPYDLMIWVDSTLDSHYVSDLAPEAVEFDPESGVLTLRPEDNTSRSAAIHLTPSDTLMIIKLTGSYQMVSIHDLTTPVLTLSRLPQLQLVDCNIGLLSSGRKIDVPQGYDAELFIQDSEIGFFSTPVAPSDLNLNLRRSSIGIL